MIAQLQEKSWSKLLTFVLSSKQECAEYGTDRYKKAWADRSLAERPKMGGLQMHWLDDFIRLGGEIELAPRECQTVGGTQRPQVDGRQCLRATRSTTEMVFRALSDPP